MLATTGNNTRQWHQSHGIFLATTIFLFGSNLAMADDNPDSSDWQFEITPYLWATKMDGDVKAGPLPKVHVDMKFSDILDNLDFGFMTAFEARKDRWGILFDGMYMKVSDSVTAGMSNIGLKVKGSMRVEQSLIAGAAAYRVVEENVPVDVVVGMRYNKISEDTKIEGSVPGATAILRHSGDKDWVDPYIGTRVIYPINAKWNAIGYLDVGGFGVGSDFTWQGLAGLNYTYSKSVTANFGYRYMKVDYDKGGFLYDMANDGLYAGVSIRF
jgi:hypothetical protein